MRLDCMSAAISGTNVALPEVQLSIASGAAADEPAAGRDSAGSVVARLAARAGADAMPASNSVVAILFMRPPETARRQ